VDEARPDATVRGYNARWKRYRVVFLARHPLCNDPHARHAVGEVVPSTVVDHIMPHRGDTTLFWDKANHQALCAGCHSHKTSIEAGGRAHTANAPALPPPSGVIGVH
jgi:5-methylcytosine-specific restriction protein A